MVKLKKGPKKGLNRNRFYKKVGLVESGKMPEVKHELAHKILVEVRSDKRAYFRVNKYKKPGSRKNRSHF